MDLNFLFNQHLKTLGLFLNKKLPDEDFKTMKFLVRQLQDSIAEQLSSITLEGNNLEMPKDSHQIWDAYQNTLSFISSTIYGGKDDNTK